MKKILLLMLLIVIETICYGTVYTVNPSDSDNFDTIQNAISQALIDGGIADIYIENPYTNGNAYTYFENLDINSTNSNLTELHIYAIKLFGQGEIILNGNNANAIYVNGWSGIKFIVKDFVIENSDSGISAYYLTNNSKISNCIIRNNSIGIYTIDSGVIIENCTLYGNSSTAVNQTNQYRTENEISYTLIYNNGNGINVDYGDIINCTVYGNTQIGINATDADIVNTISRNNGSNLSLGSQSTVIYSDIEGGATGTGNINLDPLFEDVLTNDYHLTWNATQKSPCIDTGNPAIIDVDGTPSDMGSYTYEAHNYDVWSLYRYSSHDRVSSVKWQGLPALDVVTNDGTMAFNVLEELMGNGSSPNATLDNLVWEELGTGIPKKIEYDYLLQEWENSTLPLSRIQGYKFKVIDNLLYNVNLEISGFQVPNGTTIPLKKYIPNTTNTMENWICYYPEATQEWDDAFGGLLSKIYYIQTQKWTMQRAAVPGSIWPVPPVGGLTLSRGDMVIVKTLKDIDFAWNIPTDAGIEEVVPAKATAFTYEEEMNYIPVNIEFDEADAPLEVAVTADGVCQGAAVVVDGRAQVCAYITDNGGEDLELELYYGERALAETVEQMKVYNPEADKYFTQSIKINPTLDYYNISLRQNQETTEAPETSLRLDNYPNPFNPTTNISYSLAKDSKVELAVYNVKGQLVTTLVNGNVPAGNYNVNWHGIDKQGKKVGSGIYFSRLKTEKKVLNKKMILLK